MSLLPYSNAAATVTNVIGLSAAIRTQGWSVISTHPISPGSIDTTSSNLGSTGRTECVPTVDIIALMTLHAGWYVVTGTGSGENPIPNPFKVTASVQAQGASINESAGDPVERFFFSGKPSAWIKSGARVWSDILVGKVWPANTRFFIKTQHQAGLPAAPSAPSLAQTASGGSLTSGTTYSFSLTIVYGDGCESQASTATSIAIAANNSIVTVTSPTAVVGAQGYRVWMSGSTSATPQYETDSLIPFGTDYVVTTAASGTSFLNLARVLPGTTAIPYGSAVLGGTGTTGRNNGEGIRSGADYTSDARAIPATTNGIGIGPVLVLGRTKTGEILKSVAIIGDSIHTFSNDYGFGLGRGGYAERFLLNQTTRMYDPSVLPKCGYVKVPQPGETGATFASETSGNRRSYAASWTTAVWCDYGTNDLTLNSTPPAQLAAILITIGQRFTKRGQIFNQSTLLPRATSADPYYAIANQTVTTLIEAYRRGLNNWIVGGPATTFTTETMFRRQGAATTPATTPYSGGDGTTTVFVSQRPFRTGTETIVVNGSPTVAFTYLGTTTINSITYASGVTFTLAPSNGNTVTISYTSMPGMATMIDSNLCRFQNTAVAVEVDGSGVSVLNGGWWKPSNQVSVVTGTSSGSNSTTTLNDTSKTWTVNQYTGYSVVIITDSGNPAAANQSRGIQGNTATQLSLNATDSWTSTPSSSATYAIVDDIPTSDGTHPGTYGHMQIRNVIDASKLGF